MTVQGSGTQADPWTRWEGTAEEFWNSVTNGGTYYTSVGAVWNVTDDGETDDWYDYFISGVAPSTYGISQVNYGLVGTTTSTGTVTVTLTCDIPDIGYSEDMIITLIILESGPTGPTLNVKVSGAWKQGKPYVKVNGAWKEAKKVYVKVNGTWKESK